MSLSSGFFNSVDHDRLYNAEDMSRLFDGLIRDGVFASIGTCMVVKANTKMTVNVGIGRAWFNHTWTLNDSILPIELEQSHVLWPRIDAVVLEVNSEENVRENFIKVVKGEPSTNPTKPTLTKSVLVNQYPLAYITVPAAATEIRQADIENTVGTTECPFVSGILSVISIEELIPQWKDILNRFVEENTANFNTWMNDEKAAYAQWLQSNKDDYNKLVKDQTTSYQTWFDGIKNSYTNWFAAIKEAYDTNWKAFQQWESTSKSEYNSWFSGVKSTYDSNWKDFQAWETKTKDDFDAWYETVQNQLSGDVVAKINDQLDQINAKMLSLIDASEGTVEGTVEAPIVLAGATRNLLNPREQIITKNGLTAVYKNRTITINGTATEESLFGVSSFFSNDETNGKILVGNPSGASRETYTLIAQYNDDNGWKAEAYPLPSLIIDNPYTRTIFYLVVSKGVTLNNLVFKPMLATDLTATYDDFVPYDGYDIVSAGPKLLTGVMRKYPYAAYKDGTYDAMTQTVTFGAEDNSGAYLSLNDYIYLKANGQYTLSVDVEASAAISGATIGVEGTGFSKYVTSLAAGKSTQTFDFTFSGSKLSFVCYAKGMSGKTVKLSNMKILRKRVTEANYGLYQATNSVHIGPDTKFPLYGLHSYDGNTTIISPTNFEAYTVDQYNGKALLESAKLGVEAKREKVGLIRSDDKHLPDTIKAPLMVTGATRNLLNVNGATETVHGITCTNNGDGTYTLNGTADVAFTKQLLISTARKTVLEAINGCTVKFIVVGNPSDFKSDSDKTGTAGRICIAFTNGTKWATERYDGAVFDTPSGQTEVYCDVKIESGTTLSNVTIKPMLTTDLTATYDDFVPYSGYDVKTCGKNLLNVNFETTTRHGVTFTNAGNGKVILNGTPDSTIGNDTLTVGRVSNPRAYIGKKLVAINCGRSDIYSFYKFTDSSGKQIKEMNPSNKYDSFVVTEAVAHIICGIYGASGSIGVALSNVTFNIGIAIESFDDFEPYTEGPTIHIDSSTQFPLMGLETMEGETNIISPTHIETYHTDDENGKVLLEMIYKAAESGGTYYGPQAPTGGVKEGAVWFDSSRSVIKIYNGTTWVIPQARDMYGADVVLSSSKPGRERATLWIDSANSNSLKYVPAGGGDPVELAAGGVSVGTTAPSNTKLLWIDTSSGGVAKYYNGSAWVATASVWG